MKRDATRRGKARTGAIAVAAMSIAPNASGRPNASLGLQSRLNHAARIAKATTTVPDAAIVTAAPIQVSPRALREPGFVAIDRAFKQRAGGLEPPGRALLLAVGTGGAPCELAKVFSCPPHSSP
jgi:hypothetical protein